jgi:hypothetical protein
MSQRGRYRTAADNEIHDGLRVLSMKTIFSFRKGLIVALATFALAVVSGFSSEAQAGGVYGHHRHHAHSYNRSGPIYHGPSVHYDTYYHHEYSHWTPWRGWHSHGHYDTVPHYTPGHFDYQHGNHIHVNPWFHH